MTEIAQKVEGIDQSELLKVLNLVGLPKLSLVDARRQNPADGAAEE